ncbi:LepB GTPase-activating domain-containing protein [Legionella pneumophila]|uniref:LepB protein n=1 Tax=Legionella pneumophila subsp. pascullei TaxID=91890 RepID=A0AAX2IZQ7_LEGPN|nr:LepB GTPase-activating domain-containing protein [Legionella pneumophila]AMP88948.1 type IV secretion protein Dot [Legionella pneumophila subsp. pascullei]AMP93384.1 type IV secretion protein Dot [Legionella pneumophila subsp. pascullei]AMP96350.1 type IV secretion protein Dot [Legionella pneumophila subsp. pascullei]SQG91320.1 LepB protein [Legionella pneumophila subsp. pascullei]VEH07866.1 LepB protein [Legionella pneumophila subsp. pascullei]
MLTYQGKEIVRFKEKTGGKNKSDVDGFYKDSDGRKFFIKKPGDPRELFTELFAGLLLKEFMKRGLIDESYFPSLICADVIQFEDKSYGLIQPLVSFDELHKIIGTSYGDGSDRNTIKETFFGPGYYAGITKQNKYFGLSMALMFSLLLGAHSVHSGNIVVLKGEGEEKSKQFGRIDWGDAFRYFAHRNNNDNLLYAYENRGWFNYKSLTKDYFLNYKKINGLFPAMAEKARQLQSKLNPELLIEIVTSALKNIPADLIEEKTKIQLAAYMCMDSFKEATFGPKGNCKDFAIAMATLLENRLGKIAVLKDMSPLSNPEGLYQSIIELKPLTLHMPPSTSFSETINQWAELFKTLDIEKFSFDSNPINLLELVKQFNLYVDELAITCEANNVWAKERIDTSTHNLFTPYDNSGGEAIHGHAFVPYYKESVVLRRLFSVDPNTLNLSRFAAFEGPCQLYCKEHKDSAWVKIQTLLTLGHGIINTLKIIKQAQAFGMDEAVSENLKALKEQFIAFQLAEIDLKESLKTPSFVEPLPNKESEFFYPIDEKALARMNGFQLATICLEELNSSHPSPLIERILSNKKFVKRINSAFESGVFKGRSDDLAGKIAKIREWHQLLQISAKKTARQIDELQKIVISLQSRIKKQTIEFEELEATLSKIKEKYQIMEKMAEQSEHEKSSAQSIIRSLTSELNQLKLQLQEQETLQLQLKELKEKIQEQTTLSKRLGEELQLQKKSNLHQEETIQRITKEKSLADSSLESLRKELYELTKKENSLNKTLEEKQLQVQQLEKQLSEKEKENLTLKKAIKQSQHEKSLDKSTIESLTSELNQLKLELQKQEALQLQLKSLREQIQEQTLLADGLKEELQKQKKSNTNHEETIERITKEKSLAVSALESLRKEMHELTRKTEENQLKLTKQVHSLSEQLEGKQLQIREFEKQLQEKEKRVEQSEHEKTSAKRTIASLREQVNNLKLQLQQLEEVIQEKEKGSSLISQQSKQIMTLQEHTEEQKRQLEELKVKIQELLSENQEIGKQKHSLSKENLHNKNTVEDLKKKLTELNIQLEQLHQSSSEQEQTIRKLREELIKKDSSLKQNEEMQLAQKNLQEEIDRLQKEIKEQKLNINQLQSVIAQSKEAEKRYQEALQQKKGIYFARMERVSSIYWQIQQIEQKANELEERKETKAFTAAKTLATQLRLEIKNYLDNSESDEKSALNSFKINAKRHIENSKETLNQHREEWKYLLANVTLGVFLLGIGYLAAILINRATTGNYTFFSQTNSGKKLDELEKAISSTHSETLVYG